MEPPAGGEELCILLLRQGGSREVGCQWESPEEEEETRKEVGCQSCRVETREAAVQVDLLGQTQNLLGQNLSWRHSGSDDLLQCLTVRPDGSDGGALLQHCVPNRTRTRIIRPAAKLSDEPTDTRTRKRPVPQRARCNGRPGRPRRRSPDPQEDEQEEEVGAEDKDISDPTWTPRGDRPLAASEPGPDSGPGLQQVKLELDSSVCDVCGKVMKNKSSLARHSFIHTGKKPFACHLCPLRFNRRDNLRHHLSRLHPDGAARRQRRSLAPVWLCAVCGKTFVCRSRLKTHEAIHSGVKPFRCDLCPKAYMRSNDLQHHRNVVHSSGAGPPLRPASLLCHLCGKEFKCRSQLAIHFQTHTGERPHLCDICGRKFARQYQLKRHKALLHPSRAAMEAGPPPDTAPDAAPDAAFTCGVCGRRLKSESQLTEHTRIHVGDNLHHCSVCLRGFQRAGYLRQHHLRVHLRAAAGEAPRGSRRRGASPSSFPCTVCGKAFRFRSLLASHALVHSDVRPFACDFCSRSFRRLSHLKRHRQAVHADGARPPQSFICHICGKDKKCRSQLARHVIIHTGERPFACDLCPARFNRRGNLQQHQRRMHGMGKAGEAPPILFQDEDDVLSYKQEELLDHVGGAIGDHVGGASGDHVGGAGDDDEQLDAT